MNPSESAFAYSRELRLRAVGTAFLRKRPLIVGPSMVLFLSVLAASGAPRKQLVIVGCALACLLTLFVTEAVLGRKRLFDERALLRSLVVTLLGIAGAAFVTGGVASPLVPMLFAPVGVAFAALGRTREATAMLGVLVTVAVALFASGPFLPFEPLAPLPQRILLVGTVIASALLLRVGVATLTDAHARAADSLAAAGDEVVAATRARSDMVAALGAEVAHEVKNPLAAIRALVEIMREEADDKDRRRLDVAASEVARIESILRDYLSFAHPREPLRPAPADIQLVVGQIALVFEALAARAGIHLDTRGDSIVWTVDAPRMKEALVNLLVNAFEATSNGGKIAIAWRRDEDETLVVTVSDTGRGMSATELETMGRLWTSGRDGGAGLGVVLARRVAEQHGGTLHYESRKGWGTTASLRFPKLDAINGPPPRM